MEFLAPCYLLFCRLYNSHPVIRFLLLVAVLPHIGVNQEDDLFCGEVALPEYMFIQILACVIWCEIFVCFYRSKGVRVYLFAFSDDLN